MNLRPLNLEKLKGAALESRTKALAAKHTPKVPTFEVMHVDLEAGTVKLRPVVLVDDLYLLNDGDILTVKERAYDSLGWEARRQRQRNRRMRK